MTNMQQKERLTKEKGIKIAITTIICSFILIIVLFIINQIRNSTIEILVAPTFAKIEINGKTYSSEKTIKTSPKDEDLVAIISADGFETKEIIFKAEKNQTSYIYAALNHEEDGEQWYLNQKDTKEYDRYVMVEEAIFNLASELYGKKYPITSILPYIDYEHDYRIDYGDYEGCEDGFCLQITDNSGDNHERALQYIRDHGFNPDDYQIAYKNILQYEEKNSIINYLPYEGNFILDYSYTMNGSLILSMSSPQVSIDQAAGILTDIATIADQGSIAEYNIQFTYQDFIDPFRQFKSNNHSNPTTFLTDGYNMENLQINNGVTENDYYYTTLTIGTADNRNLATFRVVLKKDEVSWKLVSQPYPILTQTNTPNVPLNILNSVNSL